MTMFAIAQVAAGRVYTGPGYDRGVFTEDPRRAWITTDRDEVEAEFTAVVRRRAARDCTTGGTVSVVEVTMVFMEATDEDSQG